MKWRLVILTLISILLLIGCAKEPNPVPPTAIPPQTDVTPPVDHDGGDNEDDDDDEEQPYEAKGNVNILLTYDGEIVRGNLDDLSEYLLMSYWVGNLDSIMVFNPFGFSYTGPVGTLRTKNSTYGGRGNIRHVPDTIKVRMSREKDFIVGVHLIREGTGLGLYESDDRKIFTGGWVQIDNRFDSNDDGGFRGLNFNSYLMNYGNDSLFVEFGELECYCGYMTGTYNGEDTIELELKKSFQMVGLNYDFAKEDSIVVMFHTSSSNSLKPKWGSVSFTKDTEDSLRSISVWSCRVWLPNFNTMNHYPFFDGIVRIFRYDESGQEQIYFGEIKHDISYNMIFNIEGDSVYLSSE